MIYTTKCCGRFMGSSFRHGKERFFVYPFAARGIIHRNYRTPAVWTVRTPQQPFFSIEENNSGMRNIVSLHDQMYGTKEPKRVQTRRQLLPTYL